MFASQQGSSAIVPATPHDTSLISRQDQIPPDTALVVRGLPLPTTSDRLVTHDPDHNMTSAKPSTSHHIAIRPSRTLRILCLDGGGVKGYTSLLILQRIFRTIKVVAKLDDRTILKPCHVFDLIVGTSTGGIIATMLGRLEMSIEEALEQYQTVGQKVFGKKPWLGGLGKLSRSLTSRPFFKIEELQLSIRDVLKAKGLNDTILLCTDQEPSCKVILCVTNKDTSKPDVLRNYRATHATQENYQCTIWEGASATAAAPIYFKPVQFARDLTRWVDGGYAANRNNPISEAMAELEREPDLQSREIGCLLSIGTGVASLASVSNNLLPFLRKTVDMLNDSEQTAREFEKTNLCVGLNDTGRYFRFNVPQGMQDLNLDDYKETVRMRALTDEYLRGTSTGNSIKACATAIFDPEDNLRAQAATSASDLFSQNVLHFVERVDIYQQMQALLLGSVSGHDRRCVLYGMGGAGKTQLALRLARQVGKIMMVFWIRSESYTAFVEDFIKTYTRLIPRGAKASSYLDQAALLARTRAALQTTAGTWLMILDNADNFENFFEQINDLLPTSGRILLTTRDSRFEGRFASTGRCLYVDCMTLDESLQLFKSSVPSHLISGCTTGSVESLLERLGYLPLAIAQAAVNVRELDMDVTTYLRHFEAKHRKLDDLLLEPFMDSQTTISRNRAQSVLVTWEISFEILQTGFPSSMIMLEYCSMVHWRAIPLALLALLPKFKDVSELSLIRTVAKLKHMSLATINGSSKDAMEINLHPLVHERVSNRLSKDARLSYLRDLVARLCVVFPYELPKDRLTHFNTSTRQLRRYLMNHVLLVSERVVESDADIDGTIRLFQSIASAMADTGRYAEAEAYARYALAVAVDSQPLSYRNIHMVRKTLIACLISRDDWETALGCLTEAFDELKLPEYAKALDAAEMAGSQSTLTQYRLLALQRTNKDRFVEMVDEMVLDAIGARDADSLIPIHNAANDLKRRTFYAEALNLERRYLAGVTAIDSKFHTRDTQIVHTYASNLAAHTIRMVVQDSTDDEYRSRQIRESLRLFQTSLAKSIELFGVWNRDAWLAANSAACVSRALKEWDTAIDDLERTILASHELIGTITTPSDDFLETIGHTWQEIDQLISSVEAMRSVKRSTRVQRLGDAIKSILAHFGLDVTSALADATLINCYAVRLITCGEAQRGLEMCVAALSLDPDRIYICQREYLDLLIYNVMIALLRLGNEQEARQWRAENEEYLRAPEEKYGDLETRLARFAAERDVYERAKEMRDSGALSYGDAWWCDHAEALERPELFYGMLFRTD